MAAALELWATFTIEVAHSSPAQGIPALHGHSYWVQCFVATRIDDPVPLAEVQAAAARVQRSLDHRNLDVVLPSATMESIAGWVVDKWAGPRLTRVIVRRESLACGVEWRA